MKLRKNNIQREAKRLKKSIRQIEAELGQDLNPNHKIYSLAHKLMISFGEKTKFRAFRRQAQLLENEYSPSHPPMSPVTYSYYNCHLVSDFKFEPKKETINSILIDQALKLKLDEKITQALLNLNVSYMSFYKHEGFDGDLILLKELISEKTFRCFCPVDFRGKKDQIWYIRIAPPLIEKDNYHIILTTPYVILNSSEEDWLAFFQRQGITKGEENSEKKYIDFMKNPPDIKYWYNYICDAYYSFIIDCIFLMGIPDTKGSKPHELGNN